MSNNVYDVEFFIGECDVTMESSAENTSHESKWAEQGVTLEDSSTVASSRVICRCDQRVILKAHNFMVPLSGLWKLKICI